jgi:hypothetical protein
MPSSPQVVSTSQVYRVKLCIRLMRAARPPHLILTNTVKLIVSCKENKLRNSSLCNIRELPVTSRPSGANIPLNVLF